MITFLRKIRKNLISKNLIFKYLYYAIGEIALVVIGILIALQINNWNEDRKDRIKVQIHYEQLKNDLLNDKTNLQNVLTALRQIMENTTKISEFLNTNDGQITESELKEALIGAEYYAFFSLSNGTYNNLISTGDIKLIKDVHLINLLSVYYDNSNWDWTAHNGNLKDAIERYSYYVFHFIDPMDFRNSYIKGFKENLRDENFKYFNTDKSKVPYWQDLKQDRELMALVGRLETYRVFQLYFYNDLDQKIDELVSIIDERLTH